MEPDLSNPAHRILGLREATAARVALRRGHQPQTEQYAYPYLAPMWADRPWAKEPILLLGALMATHDRISGAAATDDNGQPRRLPTVPQYLRHLTFTLSRASKGFNADDNFIVARLVQSQTMPLRNFHAVLNGMLTNPATRNTRLDWGSVWTIYRGWDHPQRAIRDRVRRRLLDDFFTTTDTPTTAASPADAA
jgi:hypothetical protein